jgi:hypothetical protein
MCIHILSFEPAVVFTNEVEQKEITSALNFPQYLVLYLSINVPPEYKEKTCSKSFLLY